MQRACRLCPWVLIGAVAACAALAGVFTLPLLDGDEARYAQASAQMLHSGDFLHIRFLNEARNTKPAGIYWLQAASVWLSGQWQSRAIWAWRLPSVLGAVLAALAAYGAGLALMERRAAFWGALMLAPGLLFAFEGGMAKTDAMLVAMTSLAMAALARLRHGGGRGRALLFWLALAGGVLVKGPVIVAIAGLALVVLWRWEGRAGWMRPLAFWPGPVLAATLVLPWLVLMQWGTHGAYLHDALGGDLLPKLMRAQESHGGFAGLHSLAMVLLLFPASVFLAPALVRWRGPERTQLDWRFLLAWAGPWWLLVELMPTKLLHYPLPVYPALALLAGFGVCEMTERRRAGARIAAIAGALLALLAPLALLALGWYASGRIDDGNSFVLMLPLWLWALAASLGAGWFLLRHRLRRAAVFAIGAALLLHVDTRTLTVPALLRPAPGPRLAALLARQHLLALQNPAAPPLAICGTHLPSLAFYTGASSRYVSPEGAARALARGHSVVVAKRARAAFDGWTHVLRLRSQRLGQVRAYNYTKGRPARLDVLVLAHPATPMDAKQ